jgi:hypothetical protein
MLSRVPKISRYTLKTDKVRVKLARKSRLRGPDVALKTSLLCDVRSRPTDKALRNGNLTN